LRLQKNMHLVFGDTHFPYQDDAAVGVVLEFTKKHKPGAIHLLGDMVDFYSISKFAKDPDRRCQLQAEIDQLGQFLDKLRKLAPDATIYYSEGNHELRLQKYLWSQASELSSLRCMELPSLLELRKRGVRYRDHLNPYKLGHLWFLHGKYVRKHAGASARAHVEEVGGNVIHGHTHRMGCSPKTTWEATVAGWESGCLCKLNPEYLIGKPNWQQGFSVVHYSGRDFNVDQVYIIRGEAVYAGGRISAK